MVFEMTALMRVLAWGAIHGVLKASLNYKITFVQNIYLKINVQTICDYAAGMVQNVI
mgnify:CR=1 FL=1